MTKNAFFGRWLSLIVEANSIFVTTIRHIFCECLKNVAKVTHQILAKRFRYVEIARSLFKCKLEQVIRNDGALILLRHDHHWWSKQTRYFLFDKVAIKRYNLCCCSINRWQACSKVSENMLIVPQKVKTCTSARNRICSWKKKTIGQIVVYPSSDRGDCCLTYKIASNSSSSI